MKLVINLKKIKLLFSNTIIIIQSSFYEILNCRYYFKIQLNITDQIYFTNHDEDFHNISTTSNSF